MHPDSFESRHLGPNEQEIAKMLNQLQLGSVEELIAQTLPDAIRLKKPMALADGISEHHFLKEIPLETIFSTISMGCAKFGEFYSLP